MISPDPFISTFLQPFKSSFVKEIKSLKDEAVFLFDNNINPYLDSYYRKLNFGKTFLHRNDKIEFYKLFFPIDLTHNSDKISTHSLEEIFLKSNCIAIIGNAGSGKSMLLKHFFLSAINNGYRIPILLELRKLSEKKLSIKEYIINFLLNNEIAPNAKILTRLLKNGDFIFLFDGFDEIYSDKKQMLINDIESFIDLFNKNRFIITSRPGANVDMLPRFVNTNVSNLTNHEIKKFIQQQVKFWDKEEDFSEKIISTIFSKENSEYREFVKNPLLLSMYILSFESNPEIPKKKHAFYSNVFQTLCIRHDSISKHGWVHEKKSGLSYDEIEDLLKVFSYLSFFKGKFEFEDTYLKEIFKTIKEKNSQYKFDILNLIEDLEVALSIFIRDGLDYKFPHRSLQEYFAAIFIKEKSDDLKKNIYQNQLPNISRSLFDNANNLWQLCDEIDPKSFREYFILPNLKSIINDSNQIDDMKELMNKLELVYVFEEKEVNGFHYLKENHGFNLSTLISDIFRFLNIEYYTINDSRIKTNDLKKIKLVNYPDETHTISFDEIYDNPKIFNLSTKIVDNSLKELKNNIKNKISALELELKNLSNFDREIMGLIERD